MKNGYVWISLKDIHKADWNYKEEDESKSKKLNNSLNEFGQIQNVIVREIGNDIEIVNGNHRLDEMIALDLEEAMCYNLGKDISDEKAYKIGLVTNEDHFQADPNKLQDLLKKIIDKEGAEKASKTLPYDENWLKLIVQEDDIIMENNPMFEEPPPIMDNSLDKLQNNSTEDEKVYYFKVGGYVNEEIDSDFEELYDALDFFKNKHGKKFYRNIIEEYYEQKN